MKKKSIRRWIILCLAGIFILSLAVSVVANYQENYRSMMERADRDMERCAGFVIRKLEETDPATLLSRENETEYQTFRDYLLYCAKTFGANSLLVYGMDHETRVRKIFFAVSTDSGMDGLFREALPPGTETDDPVIPVEERWLAGEKDVSGTYRNGLEIAWIHAFQDRNGLEYFISMGGSVRLGQQEILRECLEDILPIGLALLAGMIILLILARRRIIRPIAAISDSMSSFTGDRNRKPEPLAIRSKDEIGEIAAAYNRMTSEILDYVDSIESLTRERTESHVQVDIARKIQYGLVPEKTTLHGAGFRTCAMTQPAWAVGGDFYDCFQRDDGSVCIVMGDVSGKGISAAIFMAVTKTMIREKLLAGTSPAKALNEANDELCSQNPEDLFATAFAAVMNPETGELRYANAGHTRPVLLRGDGASILKPDPGIALGVFTDAGLEDHTLTLGPREGILLYTDGVTEAVNPRMQFFGEDRLLDAVKTASGDPDAEKILCGLSSAVADYSEGSEPFDDMAALILLRTPAENDDMAGPAPFRTPAENDRHAIPVALSSFEEIRQAVFAAAGETQKTRMALLACDEALANIVSYSGATELAFSCEKQDGGLCISFFDNGIPFDPTAAGDEKEFEELDSGGMGLRLIRQTVSGMRYERRQNRNELILNFSL